MNARFRPALIGAAIAICAACDAGGAYLYTAHTYDSKQDCVGTTESIDVFEGPDPGSTCGAKCLAAADGGLPVYATTMCGPTPAPADLSGANPECAGALAALARGDFCLDGGGSTNPLDASAEDGAAEAGLDASAPDAPPEAAAFDAGGDVTLE